MIDVIEDMIGWHLAEAAAILDGLVAEMEGLMSPHEAMRWKAERLDQCEAELRREAGRLH